MRKTPAGLPPLSNAPATATTGKALKRHHYFNNVVLFGIEDSIRLGALLERHVMRKQSLGL
jgi:hypothetical protein